jgi:hypothetical protein
MARRSQLSSAFPEKILHQRGAFFFQDTFYEGGFWVEGPGRDPGFGGCLQGFIGWV